MIPKTIHYCWFGRSNKPKLTERCIESWKQYCPDYEIIEWNEDNFDLSANGYLKECYKQGKYAFISDYARLVIVEQFGGLYFDTDVEVIRSFDDLLTNKAFFGFENDYYVASGLGFGAEKNNPVLKEMIKEYEPLLDGKHGTIGCPILNTNALSRCGLVKDGKKQALNEVVIYPWDYFNPMDSATGRIRITENTYSIHRYSMSWMPVRKRLKSRITQFFHRWFGVDCFSWLKR